MACIGMAPKISIGMHINEGRDGVHIQVCITTSLYRHSSLVNFLSELKDPESEQKQGNYRGTYRYGFLSSNTGTPHWFSSIDQL